MQRNNVAPFRPSANRSRLNDAFLLEREAAEALQLARSHGTIDNMRAAVVLHDRYVARLAQLYPPIPPTGGAA